MFPINTTVYNITSIILVLLVAYGIKLMSSPKTAARGNLIGAWAIAGTILLTLVFNNILPYCLLWVSMLAGTVIGAYLAIKVKMIEMPQLVALLNGLGGGASAAVAYITLLGTGITVFSKLTGGIALMVGGITLSGSIIAAAKLAQKMNQKPIILKGHSMWTLFVTLLMVAFVAALTILPSIGIVIFTALVISFVFGILLAIRVGGADMPITISLLNSFSGVAGAIAGFAIYNALLVAIGAIVGAAGLILTQIMCRGMNRNLMEILTGKTSVAATSPPKEQETSKPVQKEEKVASTPVKKEVEEKEDPIIGAIKNAKKVIIVPGYGMALAQAQHKVRELADKLVEQGKEVDFAIHPVAGRMPGHMNVLLAEAGVDYEKLKEMEEVNPQFKETDLVIIVGANDVVNPAAKSAEGTPIYGMPILDVDLAKHVIVCNYDTRPGYAGVDNPLYESENATLLLGDAAETVADLLAYASGEKTSSTEASQVPVETAIEVNSKESIEDLINNAKKVIIVPGYGMALAQAQHLVNELATGLEAQGKEVDFAIHPVAGRMPGHMNVLLAEAGVDYEKLHEMDTINPKFKDTDLVIIVGANDVVNPAAKSAEGTPIYGMPILDVDHAKHVIICNYDTKPGYAGVDNPLYESENVTLLLGDAAKTLNQLNIKAS